MLKLEDSDGNWSLNDLSSQLELDYGIEISKQSVDGRFNVHLVEFFKLLLTKLISQFISEDAGLKSELFSRILIKDSTCFQLPELLKKIYPGSGGGGSKAAIRIQFEYDLIGAQVTDLSIYSFNTTDSSNSIDTIHMVKENDLIIRDLAYINDKVIKRIEAQQGYYLNRLPTNPIVYQNGKGKESEFIEFDFRKQWRTMKRKKILRCVKQVYVGRVSKHKTKLIIELLPDDVYQKRLKQAKKNAKKKGSQITERRKAKMRFNLFITNIEPEKLQDCFLSILYKIRWQVELIFKSWKSYGRLAEIKSMKRHRVEAVIYFRLIFSLLTSNLARQIMLWHHRDSNLELSYLKISKLLRKNINKLKEMAFEEKQKRSITINHLLKTIKRKCLFEARKDRISSFMILDGLRNYSSQTSYNH